MKRARLALVALHFSLTACTSSVPDIDPHKPVVDGVVLTQLEFLAKYCDGKYANETCVSVERARRQDSFRGEMPKGW